MILFLDDGIASSERELKSLLDPQGVELRLMHPELVEQADLGACDVVVVDYFLEQWQERDDAPSVARSPRDGLAVAATLRSQLLPTLRSRTEGRTGDRPVAFALWSAHLSEATFGLPSAVLAHVFAQENNLEWAFDRAAITSGAAIEGLADLAHAVQQLPERWPDRSRGGAAVGALNNLLGVPDAPWHANAVEELLSCHPPVFELSERSHGLVVLRWMLHRILPYPTFLLDGDYLRARLRLDALPLDTEAELWSNLAGAQYTGVLSHFGGRRWWRAGVEHWLWEATDGKSGDPRAVRDLATSLGGIAEREWRQPVVVSGADLGRSKVLVEIEDAVRLRPDDWPPYADDAYAARVAAQEDAAVAAMVDSSDRHLLEVDLE